MKDRSDEDSAPYDQLKADRREIPDRRQKPRGLLSQSRRKYPRDGSSFRVPEDDQIFDLFEA